MQKKDYNHPYIIAVGENEKNIVRYYIDVERHLIDVCNYSVFFCVYVNDYLNYLNSELFQVPLHFDAIQTVDLFFKIHMVLNIHFEPNIEQAMNFLAHFIYGFDVTVLACGGTKQFKPINLMYETHNLFNSATSSN